MKSRGLIEIIVYVQDMNAQVAFYRDNFGLQVTYPAGLAEYGKEFWVTLDSGACLLALHAGGKQRLGEDAPKLVFGVDDIHIARDELLGRGVKVGEARSPAPGVWVCDGLDPEGNKFSIEAHA
jgi:predicted enzyme related to lactoylglutathione lyase